MVIKFACWTVTVVSIVASGLSGRAADDPAVRGKFIPSFAVKYAGSEGWPDLEDAAKFDLIITGAGSARQKAHPSLPGNTWQVLKRLNPAQVILLYELGPGEYNVADWGRLGPGWEWIRREHGPGTTDRWTAVGAKFGECLQGVWLQQVQIFRNLRHVRAAMNVHGPVQERANDLGRMDSTDAAGRRAWDVFWFSLASFLLGYDDQRPNGYLNCTVWGYARFYWLREFDLAAQRGVVLLKEGRALGNADNIGSAKETSK